MRTKEHNNLRQPTVLTTNTYPGQFNVPPELSANVMRRKFYGERVGSLCAG
jgi:hypothetical protein